MSDMNTDAKFRDLEHELEEREREIQMLRDSIHDLNNLNPVSEERIKGMENRINEVDGLVKGLMQEMLDVKACLQKISKSLDVDGVPASRKLARESKESRRYPPVVSPGAAAERKASASSLPEAEPAPSKEVLIIQPDGTMKPEVPRGEDMIVADHRNSRQQPGRRGDPREKKPLIYADDDDSIEIKRKNR